MGRGASAVGRAAGRSQGGLRLLQLAAFFSSFDRFAVAPMLVTIAASLGASLAETTATASLYYLLYGGMQPVWGMLSDRLGRVRVIRLTLLGAAIAGVLSAAAPNLTVLIAARALAGGLAASLDAWRVAFAAPALAGVVLAVLLTRLPEPRGFAAQKKEDPLIQLRRVLGRPWAVVVVGIALVEGAVILGFLTYLAPSLESAGFSPAVAGLAVGLYGLAVLGWTRAVKLLTNRLGASALILIGAGMLALGYASGAWNQSLASISVAAIFVGGGFAFMHSTLQTWATEVVPEARATVISLFAAALFAGSGFAALAAAPLAEAGSFDLLFALAAFVAVPLGLFASLARRLYSQHWQ